MGYAAYFLSHEEDMRQSFSQPSRRSRRSFPDGTIVDYVLDDVMDFIQVIPPWMQEKAKGIEMVWDIEPPYKKDEAGDMVLGNDGKPTYELDFESEDMFEDPDVENGYYFFVSVINGNDGIKELPADFSIVPDKDGNGNDYPGWSIEQGLRQEDGSYEVDGKSATVLLAKEVDGSCNIFAIDGITTLSRAAMINIIGAEFYVTYPTIYKLRDLDAGLLKPVTMQGITLRSDYKNYKVLSETVSSLNTDVYTPSSMPENPSDLQIQIVTEVITYKETIASHVVQSPYGLANKATEFSPLLIEVEEVETITTQWQYHTAGSYWERCGSIDILVDSTKGAYYQLQYLYNTDNTGGPANIIYTMNITNTGTQNVTAGIYTEETLEINCSSASVYFTGITQKVSADCNYAYSDNESMTQSGDYMSWVIYLNDNNYCYKKPVYNSPTTVVSAIFEGKLAGKKFTYTITESFLPHITGIFFPSSYYWCVKSSDIHYGTEVVQ